MWQIIQEVLRNEECGERPHMLLLFGNMTFEDIIMKRELDELAADHPESLQVVHVLASVCGSSTLLCILLCCNVRAVLWCSLPFFWSVCVRGWVWLWGFDDDDHGRNSLQPPEDSARREEIRFQGFITADVIRECVQDPLEAPEYLICGPDAMQKAMVGNLQLLGVPEAQIHVM